MWTLDEDIKPKSGGSSNAQFFQDLADEGITHPSGKPVAPDTIENRPDVQRHLIPIWAAFWFLSPSRSSGMGIGGIPLAEILAYCAWKEVGPPDWRDHLVSCVRAMDVAYLNHHHEKTERESKR